MEDIILKEVRQDVFDHPKSTIDLDYLYSVKKQIQEFTDETNSQLKKNVYRNYSLFIESPKVISALKDQMNQLKILLDLQQSSMNRLLDQLHKFPIVQPNLERPKIDPLRELSGDVSELEAEMLPSWFTKSSEDFDVLIAQRNLKEAVALVKKVRKHFEQYPKCCDNRLDLKNKIDLRIKELINELCSELQPSPDRSLQGGPRSSINSIKLLRELNLSSRAIKLYLDQRKTILHFHLNQQEMESTTALQFIRHICSIFFHHTIETYCECRQAFELDKYVNNAIVDCKEKLGLDVEDFKSGDNKLIFETIQPIYKSSHPTLENLSPKLFNGNDLSSHILSHHAEKHINKPQTPSSPIGNVFGNLAIYSCIVSWIVEEIKYFARLFRKHLFKYPQLSVSIIAESIYHLRNQCIEMANHCSIDVTKFIEQELSNDIKKLIDDSGKKLIDTIKELDMEEQWQPQQFQNKAQLTRFFEEMNDVGLNTMPSYIFEDLKLRFTSCKTSFARYFLITVTDLAKLVSPQNKTLVDGLIAKAFELEMESVVQALKKVKVASKVRFIMGNSNFLLDKVILVADAQYEKIAHQKCQKLIDLRSKYHSKVKSLV